MDCAVYTIVGHNGKWSVAHDGALTGSYATKEAAFEAAVSAASNAIKAGHGVQIEVPGSSSAEPNVG